MVKLFVLATALFFRLLYLGAVPASLAHDEIDNVIQAHAFIHTGTDIVGNWHPLSLLPNSGVMAEWGPLINVGVLALLPSTPFTARLTTALLSAFFPLLVWYLLEKWGASKRVAGITAILIAISPWHILFSRTVLEQPTSLFLYLTSWIFLTKYFDKQKSNKILFSNALLFSFFYLAGFMTYHGYKFSLPFLTIIVTLWLAYKHKNWKKLLIPFTVISLLFAHVAINKSNYSSRSGELVFSNLDKASQAIDQERRQTVAPEWQKKLFSNKLTYLSSLMTDKYFGIFSPDLLFLHGEANGVFSVWKTGYVSLYVIPLLLLGLYRILLEHKREQLLILILLIFSPLTSVVQSNNSYAFRSAIFFVLLLVIAAYGADLAWQWLSGHQKLGKYLLGIFIPFAFLTFGYFFYIYFYLTPIANANAYFLGDRILANYLRLAGDQKILVIDPQPRYTYSNFLLADKEVSKADIESFQQSYSPSDLDTYHRGNLTVMRSCPLDESSYDTIIVNTNLAAGLNNCPALLDLTQKMVKDKPVSLVSPKDSGEERRIYGDRLCSGTELGAYVHPLALTDFVLENMSTSEFCSKWVVRQ